MVSQEHAIGKLRLRHGKLEDKEHRYFLTDGVDVAFCNNYNQAFGEKSQKSGPRHLHSLEDFIAGLFCLLQPGAILVTLGRLSLGPSLKDANRARRKHGFDESEAASFYEMEEIVFSGRDLVSWSRGLKFSVFKYTRIGDANFLCCNRDCENARNMVPIQAWCYEGERVIVNCCPCKNEIKESRKRKKPDYFVAKGG